MLVSPSDFKVKLERVSNSSQSTCPSVRVLWEELLVLLDFTRNYERTSGIFVPYACVSESSLGSLGSFVNTRFLEYGIKIWNVRITRT